jgi:cytochrome c6
MLIKHLFGILLGTWLLVSGLISPVWAADETANLTAADRPAADLPAADRPAANLQAVNRQTGAQVFVAQCAGCHVGGGNIIRRGKNLKLNTLQKNKMATPEAIAAIVTQGKGIMSAYGKKLTAAEIADVSAYVLEQAQSGWKS